MSTVAMSLVHGIYDICQLSTWRWPHSPPAAAAAAERRAQQSIDISCPPRAQQRVAAAAGE